MGENVPLIKSTASPSRYLSFGLHRSSASFFRKYHEHCSPFRAYRPSHDLALLTFISILSLSTSSPWRVNILILEVKYTQRRKSTLKKR